MTLGFEQHIATLFACVQTMLPDQQIAVSFYLLERPTCDAASDQGAGAGDGGEGEEGGKQKRRGVPFLWADLVVRKMEEVDKVTGPI